MIMAMKIIPIPINIPPIMMILLLTDCVMGSFPASFLTSYSVHKVLTSIRMQNIIPDQYSVSIDIILSSMNTLITMNISHFFMKYQLFYYTDTKLSLIQLNIILASPIFQHYIYSYQLSGETHDYY